MKLQLSEDWSEFLSVLIAHRVKFVLIGGHAVAAWGDPRFTEDLDVLIEVSLPNARRVRAALVEFGFGAVVPDERGFLDPDKVWMLGRKPNRIDILTRIDGVSWDEVWKGRVRVDFEGGRLFVIGPDALLANKRASGRPKDLADVDAIERLRPALKGGPLARRAPKTPAPKEQTTPKRRRR
jgi:hypothetical protein